MNTNHRLAGHSGGLTSRDGRYARAVLLGYVPGEEELVGASTVTVRAPHPHEKQAKSRPERL